MSVAGKNPYFLKYIVTVIDTFADPTRSGEPTIGEQIPNAITGVPNTVKNIGGSASIASLSEGLTTKMDDAQAAINTLYSYGTAESGKGTTVNLKVGGIGVQGIDIQNTLYTVGTSGSFGNALQAIVADCIPCKERILSLLSINPIEDLWNYIDEMYQQSVAFILDLHDLLLGDKSIGVFADFCSLFKFLSFMCVPDLYSMILVLSKLMTKYAITMAQSKTSFMAMIGRISGPALTPLAGIMDKYLQLIIAPMECVVAVLDTQLQKIDVNQGIAQGMSGKAQGRSFSLDSVKGPLLGLKQYLQDGIDEVRFEFQKLDDSMKDLLGIKKLMDKQMFDITYNIQQLKNFIGLIQAIILAINEGSIICNANQEEEGLQNFINNYIGPNNNVSVTVNDHGATIKPNLPANVQKLTNTIAQLSPASQNSVSTPVTPKIAQIIIPFKNCLYTVTDKELDQVKALLGTL